MAARAPHRHALGALALSLLTVAPTFLLADGAWAQTLGGAVGRGGSKTVNGGSIGGTAASPAGGNGGNGGGNTRNGSGAGGGGGAVGGAGGNGGSRGGATPGSVNRV